MIAVKLPSVRIRLAILYTIVIVIISAVFFRIFWTPDILFIFLFGLFIILGQGKRFVLYFLPFMILLLSYDKLRSLVPLVNSHVNYMPMINFDRWVTGGILPTTWLQDHLYFGHTSWYDFYFYALYMMHFIVPIVMAVIIWRYRTKEYWNFVMTLLLLSYAGFITYLLFPAAPPWMASARGYIEPIHRISSDVWAAFGVKDFSAYYAKLSPNEVAAVPSLHAAYPLVFVLFIRKIWGTKWFLLSLIYPLSMWIGVVYLGEHYLFDVLVGTAYAVLSYLAAPYVVRFIIKQYERCKPIILQEWHSRFTHD